MVTTRAATTVVIMAYAAGGHLGGRGELAFAGASHFRGKGGASRNAFGHQAAWNNWAGGGGWGGWGGGWGGWGGWVGPVFWPFVLGDILPTCCGRMTITTRSGRTAPLRLLLWRLCPRVRL